MKIRFSLLTTGSLFREAYKTAGSLLRLDISTRMNNPSIISDCQKLMRDKRSFDFEPDDYLSAPHKLEVAILKTAYILFFSITGYSFVLDEVYDLVRQQLNRPDEKIYPWGYVVDRLNKNIVDGLYTITNIGGEGFWVVLRWSS